MNDEIKTTITDLLSGDSVKDKCRIYQVKPNKKESNSKPEKKESTVINGNGSNVIQSSGNTIHNNYETSPNIANYKFDDSALMVGRHHIGFRLVGKKVDPKNMTRKEYIHHLAYKYGFNIGKSWDGIETRPHIANWSEDASHCIKTKTEALAFLGLKATLESPDGAEKRESKRRKKSQDIRKTKVERREIAIRRKEEKAMLKKEAVLYYMTILVGFLTLLILYTFTIKGMVK
ncbi:MAG: hypothetical protein GY793_08495 [Proteobacteria bacterium]|nr:hypothetical protein [Pseudomonadota bacterium]